MTLRLWGTVSIIAPRKVSIYAEAHLSGFFKILHLAPRKFATNELSFPPARVDVVLLHVSQSIYWLKLLRNFIHHADLDLSHSLHA